MLGVIVLPSQLAVQLLTHCALREEETLLLVVGLHPSNIGPPLCVPELSAFHAGARSNVLGHFLSLLGVRVFLDLRGIIWLQRVLNSGKAEFHHFV